jgi:hypothetical protein
MYVAPKGVWAHEDPLVLALTIDGEVITSTLEHPFYAMLRGWVAAADLRPDGSTLAAPLLIDAHDAVPQACATSEPRAADDDQVRVIGVEAGRAVYRVPLGDTVYILGRAHTTADDQQPGVRPEAKGRLAAWSVERTAANVVQVATSATCCREISGSPGGGRLLLCHSVAAPYQGHPSLEEHSLHPSRAEDHYHAV